MCMCVFSDGDMDKVQLKLWLLVATGRNYSYKTLLAIGMHKMLAMVGFTPIKGNCLVNL